MVFDFRYYRLLLLHVIYLIYITVKLHIVSSSYNLAVSFRRWEAMDVLFKLVAKKMRLLTEEGL